MQVGKTVYWNDPDLGLCSGRGIITKIQGDGNPDGDEDQVFTLQMESGGETEAMMSELSEVDEPTPLSWESYVADDEGDVYIGTDSKRNVIIAEKLTPANAAFILRAVNHYMQATKGD